MIEKMRERGMGERERLRWKGEREEVEEEEEEMWITREMLCFVGKEGDMSERLGEREEVYVGPRHRERRIGDNYFNSTYT